MILPGSQLYNILVLAIGMLCWGLWAHTFRMTSRWRFELYYFDFIIGVMLAAIVAGATAGSLGWDGFALIDDIRIAGKREEAIAIAAGAVFNFGNMLTIAGLSIAGITVGYMMGLGLTVATSFVILYFTSPSGNGLLLGVGAGVTLAAAIALAVASRMHSLNKLVAQMREGKTKSTKKVVPIKGLILAAIGGIASAGCFPLINSARESENGLGPYGLGLFFAVGIFATSLILNLFFMNLPVQGDPIELTAYFQGKAKFHWLGAFGGILFYAGLLSLLVVARGEAKNALPPIMLRGIMEGAPAVGLLISLLRWPDFREAEGKVRTILAVSMLLFVAGAVSLTLSASFSTGTTPG